MSRKVLATWMLLERRKALGLGDVIPEFMMKLWKQWEVPMLVLLSMALQVILVLWGNRRRNTNSQLLNVFLWSAYMASDSVATLALGVISSNLTDALKFNRSNPPRLDPRLELVTFWAPFLLLHLGGPDTITAFQVEDNELWTRHLLSLVVQTGLTLYILFRAWTLSTLSTLSGLMLTAGSIKYAERTWSLWSASYSKRRQKAEQALIQRERNANGAPDSYQGSDPVVTAIMMFRDTEGMFADALVQRDHRFKQIVKERESLEVMKLIEMELQMMYDNLYTKARVILSYTGLALRFISFLLTCITLIFFSSSERSQRHFRSIPEYSVTLLLLSVSIILELYAAFVFLTSYRTISWFTLKGMPVLVRGMKCLGRLRTPNWSNSLGQFSEISYFLQYKPKQRQVQLMARISLRRNKISRHVYHRNVPDELMQFIHEYVKDASVNRDQYGQKFPLLQSRGRKPWYLYKQRIFGSTAKLKAEVEEASLVFEKEFAEMIIFLHLATEVCFYMDRPVLTTNVPDEYKGIFKDIFRMSRVSKHLSRYLMHLFVASSDLLPQRTPLSKRRFYEELNPSWQPFFTRYWYYYDEEEGKGKDEKEKRRAAKEKACRSFWESQYIGSTRAISALRVAHNLLMVMRVGDHTSPQLIEEKWKLLSAVWVELVVFAADQCKGKAHAQHLRQGGELLTHVWVLLGHFGFIDEALLPLNNVIDIEQLTFLGLMDGLRTGSRPVN